MNQKQWAGGAGGRSAGAGRIRGQLHDRRGQSAAVEQALPECHGAGRLHSFNGLSRPGRSRPAGAGHRQRTWCVQPRIRLWVTSKYTSNASPIRLASYEEAQLILAEAQAEQGQLDAANATLNVSRTAAGLTPFPNGQTKDQVIANVIAERRAILSFEGGHRLNDLLRKAIPWKGRCEPVHGPSLR
jgi:hypothetical protein